MTKILRRPPRIKVLEALGAIADGRIKVRNDEAEVVSSNGERVYRVIVSRDGRVYSNDNGTYYRGYVGYPIIAFLMLKGILPYDEKISKALAGIPWKELNETYKKYAIVEEIVLRQAEEKGVSRQSVLDFVNIVLKKLSSLRLVYDESLAKQSRLPL
ncbi:hypothetical protein J4526_01150 [Desulfurococcaceae archaeon MEX13E-LK6-19]|nr:hypothetical protein J4526_01150 [Desulfurococcaceae archaeon MEX13E-LK6-19]